MAGRLRRVTLQFTPEEYAALQAAALAARRSAPEVLAFWYSNGLAEYAGDGIGNRVDPDGREPVDPIAAVLIAEDALAWMRAMLRWNGAGVRCSRCGGAPLPRRPATLITATGECGTCTYARYAGGIPTPTLASAMDAVDLLQGRGIPQEYG